MSPNYHSSSGKNYSLGKCIGGGGEGDIYDVGSGMVAKIYKSSDPNRDAKIMAMLNIVIPPEIDSMVTWPKDVLFDSSGSMVGFVMRKLDSKYLFEYFTEYPRIELNPQPGGYMTFYILAKNLAFVVWKLHDAGVVIGDFNGMNIGFSEQGIPIIYDVDSFHFPNYRCGVCRPEYIPSWMEPALKAGLGKYNGETFSKESDNWALATHIFELIMNGSHPFSSVPTGTEDAKALLEAIQSGSCTFFSNIPGYEPPPYAPTIDILAPNVKDLFIRAFMGFKSDVPTSQEWYVCLDKVICNGFYSRCKEKHHEIPTTAPAVYCPLCDAYRSFAMIAGIKVKPVSIAKNKSVPKKVNKSIQVISSTIPATSSLHSTNNQKSKKNYFRNLLRKIRKSRLSKVIKKIFRIAWGLNTLGNGLALILLVLVFISIPEAETQYALHAAILATAMKLLLSGLTFKDRNALLGVVTACGGITIANVFPIAALVGDASTCISWILLGISSIGTITGVNK